ncbi:MAG: GNAT family N-acetyltransferase [Mobilitalea sp.]
MIEYCKGRPEEFEDITDFINMVFSMSGSPHDFKMLLPKLYSTSRNTADLHYLAKENGRIRAVVCVQPILLQYEEQVISCATVGSVSVHPNYRSQGYMKTLMNMALEDMEKEHITMSVLSGKRHRYQFYNYELSGHSLEYHFNKDNFKHTKSQFPFLPLAISEVGSAEVDLISELYQIFIQQKVHAIREEEMFYDICTSDYSKLFVVRDNLKVVGYFSARTDAVREIVMMDDQNLYSALNAYFAMINNDSITLKVAPYEVDKIAVFASLHEKCDISTDGNYRIFDYKKAFQFFLSVKNAYCPLTEGELVLEINNRCKFKIEVANNKVTVEDSDSIADYSYTEFAALTGLFSLANHYSSEMEKLPRGVNWFPLPLSISALDKC